MALEISALIASLAFASPVPPDAAPAPAATSVAPATLASLVAEAWAASPAVARAQADVAAAQAEVTRLGVLLPNPSLEVGGRSDVLFQAEGELTGDIALVQEIAWPGARLARRDGALHAARAARLRLALVRLDVAADVEAAVAALLAALDAAALRDDMARLALALSTAAQRRAEAGAIGTVEATLARADEALAESARVEARAAVAVARASLCALLGRRECAAVEAQLVWPRPQALAAPPLVEARADVGVARLEVEAARRAAVGAELDRIPALSVGVGIGADRTALHAAGAQAGPLEDTDQLAGINLSLALPVWDQRAGEIAAARADVARAEADLAARQREATTAVATALARLEAATSAEERLAGVDGAVAASLADLERASLAGALSLDVALATRDRLLRVRLEFVDARRRRVEAHAAALRAFADPRLVGIEEVP